MKITCRIGCDIQRGLPYVLTFVICNILTASNELMGAIYYGKLRETDGWMDEDAGNTHVIDNREMTYMGVLVRLRHTRVPL